MTWIKICGTTNLEDARLAVEAGADALGFVFAESPRRVTPEQAREIITALPAEVEKVGVFVNETAPCIVQVAEQAGLTAIQLHGEEPLEVGRTIKLHGLQGSRCPVIRSFPISNWLKDPNQRGVVGWDPMAAGLVEMGPEGKTAVTRSFDAILLDSGSIPKRGGTGMPFDWATGQFFVSAMSPFAKVIVAGGLNPSNIEEAISRLRPWGVDVVTGVECEPGKKDPQKVHAFVKAVRQADKEYSRL